MRDVIACTLLLIGLCCAQGYAWEEKDLQEVKASGDVLELTDTTFKRAIGSHDHLLVAFYTPWCSHCKALKPELLKAAAELALGSPPIAVAKVDVEKYSNIGIQYKVEAYPTLIFFDKGEPQAYKGSRQASGLIIGAQKLAAPALSVLSSDEEVTSFIKKNSNEVAGVFLGFGLQEDVLEPVAQAHKDKLWFGLAKDPSEELLSSLGIKQVPALLALHTGESSVFHGPFEGDTLESFVDLHALPLVSPLTEATWQMVIGDRRPLALAVLKGPPDTAESAEFLQRIRPAAESLREKVAFGWMDAGPAKHKTFLQSFEIDEETMLPTLFLWDHVKRYWKLSEHEAISSSSITSFVGDVLAGRVPVALTVDQSSLWEKILRATSAKSFPLVLSMVVFACFISWRNRGKKVVLPITPGAFKEAQRRHRAGQGNQAAVVSGGGLDQASADDGQSKTLGSQEAYDKKTS